MGSSSTCYYGPVNGKIGVVFNLMAALSASSDSQIGGDSVIGVRVSFSCYKPLPHTHLPGRSEPVP